MLTLNEETTINMTKSTPIAVSLTPASPLHVLPFIILPFIAALANFPPPFRGRGLLVFVLIALLEWGCTTSPWPPNIGDPRALRYGLSSSWMFILPVVERALMHTPEKEFRRVVEEDSATASAPEKAQPEKEEQSKDTTTTTTTTTPALEKSTPATLIPEFSLPKLWFSIRLACTPRAIGWTFGSRSINAQRALIRKRRLAGEQGYSRFEFAATNLLKAAVHYLVWDLVMLIEPRIDIPPGEEWVWAWDREVLGRIAAVEGIMLATVWCGMNLQFELCAAMGVGLGINEPEEWPDLFGSFLECWSVGNVWGRFWHQYIRQPCLGFSRWYVEVLRIPRRSSLAYFIHLTNAFAISTFFHVLSIGTTAGGYYPLKMLISDMSIFFMLQPVGTSIEVAVIALFSRYVWAPSKPEGKLHRSRGRRVADAAMPVICGLFGYVWVLCWFYVTTFWFVKAYAGVRMQDWKTPYSIMGKVLGIEV